MNFTKNLGKHARHCWKPNIVEAAIEANGLKEAHEVIAGVCDGTITSHFGRTGQGKETYSRQQNYSHVWEFWIVHGMYILI